MSYPARGPALAGIDGRGALERGAGIPHWGCDQGARAWAARQLPAPGSHLRKEREGTVPPSAGECHPPPTWSCVDEGFACGGVGMSYPVSGRAEAES